MRRPKHDEDARQPPFVGVKTGLDDGFLFALLALFECTVNTGLCMERRRKIAKKAIKTEIKKGIRQPTS